MKSKKKFLVLIIIVVLVCLGIGYAYLTTTLSINGVTDVDANNWDVYFDNIVVLDGSVTGSQVTQAPVVGADETSVSFHVNLKEPGDFYGFTVDAKNDGTIDAMIESVSKKLNGVVVTTLPAYLNYTVTYEDGVEIENNHLLAHESLETYRVIVQYRTDIDPDDLPSSAQSLTLSFTTNYIQADSNASTIRNYVYSTTQGFGLDLYIDRPVPESFNSYTTYQEAIFNWNDNFFLRSNIKDGNLFSSDVGFVIDGNVYYLIGSNLRFSNVENDANYLKNKNTLIQAFGSNNCTVNEYGTECENTSLRAYAYVGEQVLVGSRQSDIFCTVRELMVSIQGTYVEVYEPFCGTEDI